VISSEQHEGGAGSYGSRDSEVGGTHGHELHFNPATRRGEYRVSKIVRTGRDTSQHEIGIPDASTGLGSTRKGQLSLVPFHINLLTLLPPSLAELDVLAFFFQDTPVWCEAVSSLLNIYRPSLGGAAEPVSFAVSLASLEIGFRVNKIATGVGHSVDFFVVLDQNLTFCSLLVIDVEDQRASPGFLEGFLKLLVIGNHHAGDNDDVVGHTILVRHGHSYAPDFLRMLCLAVPAGVT